MTTPRRGIHLEYSFDATPADQRGAAIANPLVDLLRTLRDTGSISAAARALGGSYRHTWGALKNGERALGAPLVVWAKGQPARLTPLAERLLWAETRARTRLAPHIEALRSELERVLSLAFDSAHEVLTVYASHDLALPLLREQADAHGLHIDLRFVSSADALQALAQGRCDVAGFHVPLPAPAMTAAATIPSRAMPTVVRAMPMVALAMPAVALAMPTFARALRGLLKPGRHKLLACHRRTQGLIVAPGNPHGLAGVAALARPGLRFVNRQPGSGTRLLTEHLLAEAGVAPERVAGFHGPCEETHVAVAAAVASGVADVGVGIQAAAAQFGLGFVALAEEAYYLVCLKDTLPREGITRLRELLGGAAWADAVRSLAGCTPALDAGQVLALTQALPWWHYRKPRPH